jgi:hypothetical protein
MFQIEVLWIVTPCIFVVGYQRFGGPCCLHLQGKIYHPHRGSCCEIWVSRWWNLGSRSSVLWRIKLRLENSPPWKLKSRRKQSWFIKTSEICVRFYYPCFSNYICTGLIILTPASPWIKKSWIVRWLYPRPICSPDPRYAHYWLVLYNWKILDTCVSWRCPRVWSTFDLLIFRIRNLHACSDFKILFPAPPD